jgi:hypothetical protein
LGLTGQNVGGRPFEILELERCATDLLAADEIRRIETHQLKSLQLRSVHSLWGQMQLMIG